MRVSGAMSPGAGLGSAGAQSDAWEGVAVAWSGDRRIGRSWLGFSYGSMVVAGAGFSVEAWVRQWRRRLKAGRTKTRTESRAKLEQRQAHENWSYRKTRKRSELEILRIL